MGVLKGDKPSSKRAETDRFLDRTLDLWHPHSSRCLTREDARETAENIVGFFRILQEWEVREKAN